MAPISPTKLMACRLDPVLAETDPDYVPDKWQKALLRSQDKNILILCSRQAGKSTTAGRVARSRAVFHEKSLVLLLSPSLRQSSELFRKFLTAYLPFRDAVPPIRESALQIELTNGSRVIALPGAEDTVRGYSAVDVLIIDEASKVDDYLYKAVRPMLAVSGGQMIALTTPFGKRGWFFDAWQDSVDGKNSFKRTMVTADDISRIPAAFLEEEKRALGDWWFRQEYYCEFQDTIGSVFKHSDIMAAMSSEGTALADAEKNLITDSSSALTGEW